MQKFIAMNIMNSKRNPVELHKYSLQKSSIYIFVNHMHRLVYMQIYKDRYEEFEEKSYNVKFFLFSNTCTNLSLGKPQTTERDRE